MNRRLVLFVGKTDVVLRRYISSLRFAADGGVVVVVVVVAREVLRVFRMQGIGSFLLHLTPRFGLLPPSDLHSFRYDEGPRAPSSVDPFFLYSLFTSRARIVPPFFFTPLFANHPASRSLRFLPVFLFLLFSSHSASSSFFLFFHHATMHTSVLFYQAIILALLLPCPSSHPHLFLLSASLSLSLVCLNFLR